MSIFTKAVDGLKSRFPIMRRPQAQSQYMDLLYDHSWILARRDKSRGIGLHTYYKAGQNVWVNACIQVFVNEVRNLGFKIKSPEDTHQNVERVNYLTNLFNNPMGYNSQDTYSTLQSPMWHSLLLLGDAFCEVINDEQFNKIPIGFKFIPTELMHYYDDTDQWGFINNGYRFESDQLIHVKEPGIRGSVWGRSPIDVLARDLTLEILGRSFTKEILERKGLDPSGVIEFDSNLNDQAYSEEIARLTAMANGNRRGTMVLRGARFNKVGITQEDMEYNLLMSDIRDRIIATFGVPPTKVSIMSNNLHEDTVKSQDRQFKKTFSGKAKLFEDAFNKVLGRTIFRETFQYNELDIEDKLVRAQIEDIRLNNGTLTINEVRSGYSQPPLLDEFGNVNRSNVTSMKYKDALRREGVLKRNYE